MSAPEGARFDERLAATLAQASRSGHLSDAEYEALLAAPDFDHSAFRRFEEAARAAGVALPDTDLPESEDAPASQGASTPRNQDLLDLYLHEIGRFALLQHRDL